jgi:GT2 family glycosyltransferase
MSYSVVIPTGNVHNLRVCVGAIRSELYNTSIVVVNDGGLTQEFPPPSGPFYVQGPEPFIFSRNINLGIRTTEKWDNVILMNDDAVLVSGSPTHLMGEALRLGGIVSASVRGAVNNPEQQEREWEYTNFPRERTRELKDGYLAFVCVAIPRSVINRIGLLDERFTTYGGEDVDYCHSARVNGIPLAVYDGCVVDHGNILPSTFRRFSVPDIEPGLKILRDKWERIRNTPLPL